VKVIAVLLNLRGRKFETSTAKISV